jgi:putative membrane protein
MSTTTGEPGRAPARRPRSVYGVGSEPDPRVSLANERTALAWIRTGLGLVAAGVALASLSAIAEPSLLLDGVAAASCLAGGAVAVSALASWRRTERAIRLGEPLPAPRALPVLVGGVAVVAVLLAVDALLTAR